MPALGESYGKSLPWKGVGIFFTWAGDTPLCKFIKSFSGSIQLSKSAHCPTVISLIRRSCMPCLSFLQLFQLQQCLICNRARRLDPASVCAACILAVGVAV